MSIPYACMASVVQRELLFGVWYRTMQMGASIIAHNIRLYIQCNGGAHPYLWLRDLDHADGMEATLDC